MNLTNTVKTMWGAISFCGRKGLYILLVALLSGPFFNNAFAQGSLSGGLQTNGNFFVRDTSIGAANTPQYDNLFSGYEGWLNLNYSNFGFDLGLRFDFYLNSNLPDPQAAFTGQGIGNWFIKRKIHKLDITAGHFYDQIGSGIIFRAYEERLLGIDNSLMGLRLAYDLSDNWKVKTMLGRQRNPFGSNGVVSSTYKPIIASLSFDGYVPVSDDVQLAPGGGVVNRVLDEESMALIVADINTYAPIDSFIPKYNVYAFSLYNTLTVKDFSWYIEGAFKTNEAIVGPEGILVDKFGSVIMTNLSYSRKGFGITVQGKRVENFILRTSPNEILNEGVINFLPPTARQNTKRLAARYNANTSELSEWAFQVDLLFKPAKNINAALNFSNITDLDGNLLFREAFAEARFKNLGTTKKWTTTLGLQYQEYNQDFYEVKPGVPNVISVVPMTEIIYKIDRKKTIRTEVQYQHTQQDFGSFFYVLGEFTIAPSWSFSFSNMVNIKPRKTDERESYYDVSVGYTHKSNKFTFAWVKQIEGIVCTGGVCRFEPAFNGARITLNSSF
ncbi:MAG: DUF6029 family protein [Bacteroidota bacterium]